MVLGTFNILEADQKAQGHATNKRIRNPGEGGIMKTKRKKGVTVTKCTQEGHSMVRAGKWPLDSVWRWVMLAGIASVSAVGKETYLSEEWCVSSKCVC